MTDLRISEVNVEPLSNRNGLIGFSSFAINGDFKIANVAIYTCPSSSAGIRLVFPDKEYKGLRLKTIYPINKAAYEVCVVAVAAAYRELMEKLR